MKVVTGDDEAADPPKLSSSSSSSFRVFNFLAEEIVVFSTVLKTSFSNIFGVVDSIEDAVEDAAVAVVVVAKELFVVVGFGVVIGTRRDVVVVDKRPLLCKLTTKQNKNWFKCIFYSILYG